MISSHQPTKDRPKMPASYGLSQNAVGQIEWEWVQKWMKV